MSKEHRVIKRAFDPRGRLQQFKLAALETATCFRCTQEKTSKSWAILDSDWNKRLCNGCYGKVCSEEN